MPNQFPGRPREAQYAQPATGRRDRNNHSRADNEAVSRKINTLLLKCHARLAVSGLPYIDPADRVPGDLSAPTGSWWGVPDPQPAGEYLWAILDAEDAAELAARWRLSQQRARARLYLGHCFRALEQWKEALQCYIDAASVWGMWWGQADIQGLTRLCRWHLSASRQGVRRRPARNQVPWFERHSETPLDAELCLDASMFRDEDGSGVATPSEPIALMDGDGEFVGFMIETPGLRRVRRSPDLRGEDWRRRKQEEERHPSAARAPRVAYRRILSGPSV